MVLRRRLWEPHITGVSCKLTAFQSSCDGVSVTDLSSSGVHDVGSSFHGANEFLVEQMLGFWVERAVDGHYIADFHHIANVVEVLQVQFLFDLCRKSVAVAVGKFAVEGFHSAKHGKPDSARGDGSHGHSLHIVSPLDAVCNIPTLLVS